MSISEAHIMAGNRQKSGTASPHVYGQYLNIHSWRFILGKEFRSPKVWKESKNTASTKPHYEAVWQFPVELLNPAPTTIKQNHPRGTHRRYI